MLKIIFSLMVVIMLPLCASAEVQEFRLDNGLKILFIEDHKIPLASFQIWYKVGAIDEPAGKSGISHMLEHMMFKGTPKYGSKVFSNMVQRKGGSDNAFTTKDYTMYYQKIPSSAIRLSIELEADRMKNLLLKNEDVIAERSVVQEERRMRYEDNPQHLLYEMLQAAAFQTHAYRKPVIGWMAEIAALSREDLAEHYSAFYSPDNAFIIISGDVNPAELMPFIKEKFGSIPAAGSRIKRVVSEEVVQLGERSVTLESEAAELPAVIIAYHVPSFPDDDSFALDVLSTILSSGKSSRLYRSLVYEKRLVLGVSADYEGLNRAPHLFTFSATAAPEKKIKDIEKALMDEIILISKQAPSASEVQKARNQVEAAFVFARDSSYSEALYTGMFEVVGSWRMKEKYLEGIRKVTPGQVMAVAKKYLVTRNRTVGYLVPVKAAK